MQATALTSSAGTGISGTIRQTLELGGLRAFYTGLALPLAAQAVYKGTIFTVNNVMEHAIQDWKTQENYRVGQYTPYSLSFFDRFTCGFVGGAVNAALFVTPVEFVRNQQIVTSGDAKFGTTTTGSIDRLSRNTGPLAIARATIRTEGFAGLWRGIGSTILRDSLGCGCFFATMAYTRQALSSSSLQQALQQGHNESAPSHLALIVSGACAGVSFWIFGLPLDTMKTWIQNGTARNLHHAWQLSQRGGFTNGLISLNRGWQVAYGRGAPAAAITVTTYSLAFTFLTT